MRRILHQHGPLLSALVLLLAVLSERLLTLQARCGGALVYALDDAYIHLAIARNFAEAGVWGLNPEGFSNSTSSLLWTLLLAVGVRLGLGEYTPLIAGLFSAVLLLTVADAALRMWRLEALPRALILSGLVLVTPMPAMVLSGMEHLLHAALTLAFLGVLARHRHGLVLLLATLLPLVRFEGLFLVGLSALWMFRQPRLALRIALVGILPVLIWAGWSLWQGWMVLPNSVALKSTILGVPPAGWPGALWTRFLADLSEAPAVAVLAVAVLVLGQQPALRATSRLFAAATLAHLVFARVGWFYRYEVYLIASGWVLAAVGGFFSWRAGKRSLVGGLLLVYALSAGHRSLQVSAELPERVEGTWRHHLHLASFFAEHYPGQAIASSEAGAISWSGCCRFVDLIGLGNIEVARHRQRGTFTALAADDILQREGVEVIALYQHYFQYTVDWPPPKRWIRVGVWREPQLPVLSELVFFARSPAAAHQLAENLHGYASRLAPPMELVLDAPGAIALERFSVLGGVVKIEPDRLAFYSNGAAALVVKQSGTLHLEVSGSLADGVGPHLTVSSNGEQIEADITEAHTEIRLPGLHAGDRVEVHYSNDVVGSDGADRNLYLWSARLQ